MTPPPSSSSSPTPITRIATFLFHPTVTAAQKSNRASAFLALYTSHRDLLLNGELPKGGRPLNTPLNLTDVKRDEEWDMGFVVTFKSDSARREFDRDPGHDGLKNETDPLLAQVFVYDFEAQTNLGWE